MLLVQGTELDAFCGDGLVVSVHMRAALVVDVLVDQSRVFSTWSPRLGYRCVFCSCVRSRSLAWLMSVFTMFDMPGSAGAVPCSLAIVTELFSNLATSTRNGLSALT